MSNEKVNKVNIFLQKIIDDNKLSQKDLAKSLDISESYVTQILQGKKQPSKKLTRLIEMIYGAGSDQVTPIPPPAGTLPVVGMGQGGNEGYWEDAYPVGFGHRTINRPYDVTDPLAFAVEVRGQSMSPKYEEGEIVVCSPVKEAVSGDCGVVKLKNGAVMVKRLRFPDGFVILESVNPAFEPIVVQSSDIDFIRKIVWKKEK